MRLDCPGGGGRFGTSVQCARDPSARTCGHDPTATEIVLAADTGSSLCRAAVDKQLTIRAPTLERSIDALSSSGAEGLQPCPPHDWRCPVTMKLDPERAAWTCARCGAIATTELPAVMPD